MVRSSLVLLAAALTVMPVAASRTHSAAASSHSSKHSGSHAAKTKTKAHSRGHKGVRRRLAAVIHKLHGQQAIAPDRVSEIQTALIREHYLDGPANGDWDSTTVSAMQKYQADQGWQTKLMPDSRALKKLGLGADYSTAINAKGNSFGGPLSTKDIPAEQASGFVDASGVNQ